MTRTARALLFVSLFLRTIVAGDPTKEGSDQSLLWGTYRANLYFGLRPRIPNSIMTGLMWHGLNDYQSVIKMRHACEQGDGLEGYTWTEHDLRYGGSQFLNDTLNHMQISTEWLKVPGGEHGGSWAARISGKPLIPGTAPKTSLIFYVGIDGLGSLDLENDEDEAGLAGPIKLAGVTQDLGDFSIRIVDGKGSKPVTEGRHEDTYAPKLGKTSYAGLHVRPGDIWTAKDVLLGNIISIAQPEVSKHPEESIPEPAFVLTLSNEVYTGANLFGFQKAFEGEFSFDVYYDAADVKQKLNAETLTSGLKAFEAIFNSRFLESFPLREPFASSPEHLAFAKAITSNLFGGIGYFYGDSIEDRVFAQEWDDEEAFASSSGARHGQPIVVEPRELLTATPSRSFFPRGFYWDEGFHLLIVGAWDNDLSLEILKSWIDLIDEDGWVGREQILGPEARSKVPPEFQTQYPTYANPPTLAMALSAFIERLRSTSSTFEDQLSLGNDQAPLSAPPRTASNDPASKLLQPEAAHSYLRSIYPTLRRHYDWFRRTQRGQIKQWNRRASSRTEAYRWRGRTESHVLTSGLDDYPRAVPPHTGELHLDLISWMASFTRAMREIAGFLGETEDEAMFETTQEAMLQNIEDLHWSQANNMYCDVSIDEDENSYHVCHKGYISIFPFLLGLLSPDSPHLGAILADIRDPEQLWSPYGIRSLSKAHPLFGEGENYWRGPIWVQMNYMALSTLYKTYVPTPGPYQPQAKKLYDELRDNIIHNVFKEYRRTGYVWEQYDAITGEGRRSHPFTGWTSLVTLIMAENY